jgi:RND family efflux transporter MFP subunit
MHPSHERNRWDVRRIGFILCLFCIQVLLYGCGPKQNLAAEDAESAGVPVAVSHATMRTMILQLTSTGTVAAFAEAAVVSEVAGTIEKLFFERGQQIKKGETIAIVEHAEASARLQEAEAALQAARAQLLQAEAKLRNVETEHKRITTLYEDGVASRQMLDEINANRDATVAGREVALAQIAQAEAAVRQARVFLENHTICAPISGIVTERFVDEGDKNNPSEPVVKIARMDPVKIQCNFPERDLSSLSIGQQGIAETDAYPTEKFPAEVKIISPCLDAAARTVEVELWAPNPDGRLRAGMFARVTLMGKPMEVLAVPDDALTRIPGTGVEFVFVVDRKIARRTDLEAGYRAEGWTEVSGEIQSGDVVVVEGQNNLKSGSAVRIVTPAEE